jgi:hypothetical protein
MSTRSSIWLGENDGKRVHVYWELAERDSDDGKLMRVPVYIAVEGEEQEVKIRLPKDIAIRLLMGLSPKWADEVAQVI